MRSRIFALACAVGIATGCGGSTDYGTPTTAPQTTTSDQINANANNSFSPSTLTTQVGHTVSFVFGSVAHNVFFDAATGVPADIPTSSATTVTRVFSTAGTFTYNCRIHPGMSGTVVVQ
jgi:plastocyanin